MNIWGVDTSEPFALYVSKGSLDKTSKAFGLGLIVRKPMFDILRKMNVPFKELDRDEAKEALERVTESKGVTITTGKIIKSLSLAFFLPTSVFVATLKKLFTDLDPKPGTS